MLVSELFLLCCQAHRRWIVMIPGKGPLLLVVFALFALGVDLAGEHLGHRDGRRLGLGDLFLLLVVLFLLLLGCSSS